MTSLTGESAASTSGHRTLALFTVLASQLMLAMDLLIVVVALPRIEQDLGLMARDRAQTKRPRCYAKNGPALFIATGIKALNDRRTP